MTTEDLQDHKPTVNEHSGRSNLRNSLEAKISEPLGLTGMTMTTLIQLDLKCSIFEVFYRTIAWKTHEANCVFGLRGMKEMERKENDFSLNLIGGKFVSSHFHQSKHGNVAV
ncbi:hypothetical protein SLA2020_185080 [Shorea laevis]